MNDMTIQSDASAAQLALLAGHSYIRVRLAVAEHPNTPAEALARLAGESYVRVRLAVAEHPNTPAEALALLAGDGTSHVRRAVAMHPSTPMAALTVLVSDPDVGPDVFWEAVPVSRTLPPLARPAALTSCLPLR